MYENSFLIFAKITDAFIEVSRKYIYFTDADPPPSRNLVAEAAEAQASGEVRAADPHG